MSGVNSGSGRSRDCLGSYFFIALHVLVQYSFIRKLKVTFLSNSAKAGQVSLDTTIPLI